VNEQFIVYLYLMRVLTIKTPPDKG